MTVFTDILGYLLKTSVVSVWMIIVIMVIRQLFHKRINGKWSYYLWLLLLVRLLFPFQIESAISVENLIPLDMIESQGEAPIEHNMTESHIITYSSLEKEIYQPITPFERLLEVLTYVWLFGIFVVVFMPIISYITLKKAIAEDETAAEKRVQIILNDALKQSKIQGDIKVKYSYYLDSPALIGVIKPMIIIPLECGDLDDEVLYKMLLHELMHLKYHHLIYQWLFWIVKAVYWFNPLVWLAHQWMKLDAEYMCDEAVVDVLGETKGYGTVLIDLASGSTQNPYTINAAGLINKKSELKKRIIRLGYQYRKWPFMNMITIILLIMMIPTFFTTKASPVELIPSRIIRGQIGDRIQADDYIGLELIEYNDNMIEGMFHITFEYRLSGIYEEVLEKSVAGHEEWMDAICMMDFLMTFQKSYKPELRENPIHGTITDHQYNGEYGTVSLAFDMKNYDPDIYGDPTIVLSNFTIDSFFNEEAEMYYMDLHDTPLTVQVDAYTSKTYNLYQGRANELKIVSKVNSDMDLNVYVNEDIEIIDAEGNAIALNHVNVSSGDGFMTSSYDLSKDVTGNEKVRIMIYGYQVSYSPYMWDKISGFNHSWTFEIDVDEGGVNIVD